MFRNPIKPQVTILRNDRYGMRTLNGRTAFHNGVDLRPQSDDIYASHDGVVTFSGIDQYGALWIQIDGDDHRTRYVHNRQNLVKRGDVVKSGQLIGYIGSTGRSTGRHLHFETWLNGVRVDPEKYVDFSKSQVSTPIIVQSSRPTEKVYVVKPGDTLSQIVDDHYRLNKLSDIKAKYEEVAKYNGIENPNKIYVNQKIILK